MKYVLPYKFDPYPFQQHIINLFFKKKYKYFINILPRRHGKDRTAFNIMVGAALMRKGLYFYAYPKRSQAKTAIWKGIMPDGTKFLDHIPPALIDGKPHESDLEIRLINGSIIKLVGMDYYDNLVGTNPFGIVFSEYAVGSPKGWDIMRPVLRQNGGWAYFVYTPRGHNHGYNLYNINKNNPEWYCELRTVNDCKDKNNNPIISDDQINEDRLSGMSENLIQQEYYCDFESTLEGAIFTTQLQQAYQDDRIKEFPINTLSKVYTFWDLGDATAIWFIQYNNEKETWDSIYYYENRGQPISHYISILSEIQKKFGIIYGGHYAPHDIAKHSYQTGLSHFEYAAQLGITFHKVRRIAFKEDAIERARFIFGQTRFHEKHCESGLNALKSYCRDKNTLTNEYGAPRHDWASHPADAFMTYACSGVSPNQDYSNITHIPTLSHTW